MDPILTIYALLIITVVATSVVLYRLRGRLGFRGKWLIIGSVMALFRVLSFLYLYDLRANGKVSFMLVLSLPLYVPEIFLFPGDPFTADNLARYFTWSLTVGSYVIVGTIILVVQAVSRIKSPRDKPNVESMTRRR